MGSRYEYLLDHPEFLIGKLNPNFGFPNNCPATADSLDNWLRTGIAQAASGYSGRYHVEADFRRASIAQIETQLLTLGTDHHFVVRGTRRSGSGLTPNHFFVLANIRNRVVLLDAYHGEVLINSEQITEYLGRNGGFFRFDYATSYEAIPPHED